MSPRSSQRAATRTASVTRAPTPSMDRAAIPLASPQPHVASPSVSGGDLALFALPRDMTGRLVVVLPLLMAVDLLAPWIVFGDAHIAPSSVGLLALLAALPLALITAMTVYLPFRQRPILAAIPLIIAALALGGALLLVLIVGPFGARVVSVIGAGTLAHLNVFLVTGAQTPFPTPLTLSPDVGLIVFIVGAGALVFACYRRLEALIAGQYLTFAHSGTTAAPPALDGEKTQESAEAAGNSAGARPAIDRPTAPSSPLPGTPGWTEAPSLPAIMRNGPAIRGMRRIDPRS